MGYQKQSPSKELITYNLVVDILDGVDKIYVGPIGEYKRRWDQVWNPLRPLDEQQMMIDSLFNTPGLDVYGKESNQLDNLFDDAYRALVFLSLGAPDEFSDELCPKDWRDTRLPDFPDFTFQKYKTAGWIYTMNQEIPGAIIMVEPIQYVDPNPPAEPETPPE